MSVAFELQKESIMPAGIAARQLHMSVSDNWTCASNLEQLSRRDSRYFLLDFRNSPEVSIMSARISWDIIRFFTGAAFTAFPVFP